MSGQTAQVDSKAFGSMGPSEQKSDTADCDGALPDGVASAKEKTAKVRDDGSDRDRSTGGAERQPDGFTSSSPDLEEGEVTPPLPNGEKRLHPLFDEDKIASEAAALSQNTETNTPGKEKPNALRLLDTIASEPGYPSPSGGFVPPVTDDNWVLSDPPAPRSANAASRTTTRPDAGTDRPQLPSSAPNSPETKSEVRHASSGDAPQTGGNGSSITSTDEVVPQSSKSPIDVNPSKGASSSGRSSSSASSTASFMEGATVHSQAISARSSPSTVAPVRRRSSASADVLSMTDTSNRTSGVQLPLLKIRDFAFTEVDPRHVGARDVGLPSPDQGGHSARHSISLGLGRQEGSPADLYDDDEEEDEEEEDEGDLSAGQTALPPGLYHAAYDFTAESEHELDVKVGQRVRLIGHVDGGWAIVVRVRAGDEDVAADDEDVDKGLVPQAYLEWLAP